MPTRNSNDTFTWTLLLVLMLAAYFFIMFAFSRYDLWFYAGVPHAEPVFYDTHYVLQSADSLEKGEQTDYFVYPWIWLWIGKTGLEPHHATAAGAVLGIVFFLSALYITRPGSFKEFIITATLFFSPAVMMAFERGNIDLVIFILLTLSGLMLGSGKTAIQCFSPAILLAATVLKVYPILTFTAFIRYIKSNKLFYICAVCTAAVLTVYLFIAFDDIMRLKTTAPRPTTRYTFGASLFFIYLGFTDYSNLWVMALGIITGVAAYFLSQKIRTGPLTNCRITSGDMLFLFGSLTLVFCFFVTTNFNYRCIFFILLTPFLFETLKNPAASPLTRKLVYVFFLLLFVFFWNEFLFGVLNFWGKAAQRMPTAERIQYIFSIIEQLCSWTAMVILLSFTIALLKKPAAEKLRGLSDQTGTLL